MHDHIATVVGRYKGKIKSVRKVQALRVLYITRFPNVAAVTEITALLGHIGEDE